MNVPTQSASDATTPQRATDTSAPVTRYADTNGIRLAYETFGASDRPPVLLIMGLGTQMIAWPDEMCQDIADRGHYVIRFDNRDVGLSTHLHGVEPPSIAASMSRRQNPPYTLDDMADDAVGLMDVLGLESAHVVGASLGGFIAQTVAIRYPQRVRSLTLIMTSTGSQLVGRSRPTLMAAFFRRRPAPGREAAIEATIETFRAIGSPGFPPDQEHLRDLAARSYDRAYDPNGYLRQLAAILAQPNRTDALGRLRMPVTVIHGLSDPLVSSSGGRAIAKAVPRSRLVAFNGMGHDLPRDLWPQFADEICSLAASAERAATS